MRELRKNYQQNTSLDMDEFYIRSFRNIADIMEYKSQKPVAYAVGTDGSLCEVPYMGRSVADYFSELCRTCIGAVYELPKVMLMGKIHGVQHKAKSQHDGNGRSKWVERNPKHLNGNKNGKKKR